MTYPDEQAAHEADLAAARGFDATTHRFADGDWVLVYAQVTPMGGGRTPRPEEINVRMESKGEDYHALVRRDHVHSTITPPPGWPRCTRLLCTGLQDTPSESLVRCAGPSGHAGKHRSTRGDEWAEDATYGYVEERS